jgi:hypothetical protein
MLMLCPVMLDQTGFPGVVFRAVGALGDDRT